MIISPHKRERLVTEDNEYIVSSSDEDETTIEEEEILEGEIDHAEEMNALTREGTYF